MNKKLLNILLLASFLFCYLEWPNNAMFVFQLEWNILFGNNNKTDSFLHPAVLLPFLGELFFVFALFQNKRWPTIAGIILCGLLVLMFLTIGMLGMNAKMLLCATPFVVLSILYFVKFRETKGTS